MVDLVTMAMAMPVAGMVDRWLVDIDIDIGWLAASILAGWCSLVLVISREAKLFGGRHKEDSRARARLLCMAEILAGDVKNGKFWREKIRGGKVLAGKLNTVHLLHASLPGFCRTGTMTTD